MAIPRRVIITVDNVSTVVRGIISATGKQVLVGIPEEKTGRDDPPDKPPITNAALGYIHENGAPEANIPARPWLVPGVIKSNPQTIPRLERAYGAALDGKPEEMNRQLEAAAQTAETVVKQTLEAGEGWPPLSPVTIRMRRYSRRTQSMRAGEQQYLDLIAGGSSPAEAQEAANIRPLINTAQLRNAITSVVRDKND